MDLNDLQILPPANWEKFEDLCFDIFREQWGDPYAQKNGRRGQQQHGVDISGTPHNAPGAVHGVQCKGKDAFYGAVVTKAELDAEVARALTFQPNLDTWVLVTTASKDAAIEEAARQISIGHHARGLFKVKVFGWEDLRSRIADSDFVMTKHYPDQAPRQREILARLAAIENGLLIRVGLALPGDGKTASFQSNALSKLDHLTVLIEDLGRNSSPNVDPAEAILQVRIDDLRTLIQEHQPASALRQVERLIAQCWGTCSDLAKFRLLANKAAAFFNLGRSEEGAHACLEAFPFAPGDARATVYASQAHIVLGDIQRARNMLDELLSRDPENDDAIAMRIGASEDEIAVSDPHLLIPTEKVVAWNVTLSIARWYRHRGMRDQSVATFMLVLAAQPDRTEVMAEAASYTLECVFRDKAAIFAHRLESSEYDKVRWAVGILGEVWDNVKNSEVRDAYIWSVANLCSAHRYLSEYDLALERLNEALSLAPNNRELLQQRAITEGSTGKYEQLLITLDAIGSLEAEALLMRSDAFEALNRPLEALAALANFPKASSARHQITAAGTKVRCLVAVNRPIEALAVSNETIAAFPSSAFAMLVAGEFYRHTGQKEDALHQIRSAVQFLNDDPTDDGLERFLVAEAFTKLGDWEGAADLLANVGDPREDSAPLRLRVQVLLNAGRRQELRRLLEAMPTEVASAPVYARSAAWLYRLSGDYSSARSSLEIYLREVPKDLSMHMLWLDVLEQQEDQAEIQKFLSADLEPLTKNGATRDVVALSQCLVRWGFPQKGLEIGYNILREKWSEAAAHLGFFGIMMTGDELGDAIPTPTSIEAGVAFTVEDEGGHRRAYVIETARDLKLEFNEVAPGSRLALAAIGRRVGDTIRINESELLPEQQVMELKHKYLNLFHRSLNDFNSLFPDNRSLIGMRVDPAYPERFIERMKPALAAKAVAEKEMLELYDSSELPIAFAARVIGLDVIEGWNAICNADIPIDVCVGIEAERDGAAATLQTMPPLILDPMTFWIAGTLGVLDSFAATFGPLGLTASSIEFLAARAQRATDKLERDGGVLFEYEGGVGFAKPTDSEKRQPAVLATRLLTWARANAVIVPAIPAKDLNADVRRVGEMAHPSIMDTIVAASGSRRVLLCEDRRIRVFCTSLGIAESVWLQPVLQACLLARTIRRGAYSDALLNLASWGHRLTSLDSNALLRATVRWGDRSSAHFPRVVAGLASPTLELHSLLGVVSAFIKILWQQPRARARKEMFSSFILEACQKGHPDTPAIIARILEHTAEREGRRMTETDARHLRSAGRFVKQWSIANATDG